MSSNGKLLLARRDGVNVLKFRGEIRLALAPTLATFVSQIGSSGEVDSIVIDMSEVACIDSTMLGMLAKVSLRSQEVLSSVPTIISPVEDITRILISMGFDSIFAITGTADGEPPTEGELPTQIASDDELCEQVIEAHRVLMSLNQANEDTFRDLVESLENEQLAQQIESPIRAVR
ncbi:MAG: STAS domain-containing protein [Gammaproteobacteria bacterium]|nr:STAS domain-containing protein [Gammaproteobacteria bacterium]